MANGEPSARYAIYYAPRSARFQRLGLRALPEAWADRILARVYRSASQGG